MLTLMADEYVSERRVQVASQDVAMARVRALGEERDRLRQELADVSERLAEAVREAAELGVPDQRLARLANVAPRSVRVWRGKERAN